MCSARIASSTECAVWTDPNLVERLPRERICLDVCPSSNVALGTADTLETHPLAELLSAGVRCSINADGPLLFNTTLLEEYRRAQACLGLDERTLARVAQTSIDASAAPDAVRRSALSGLDGGLTRSEPHDDRGTLGLREASARRFNGRESKACSARRPRVPDL
jgi:adenosine deaminase